MDLRFTGHGSTEFPWKECGFAFVDWMENCRHFNIFFKPKTSQIWRNSLIETVIANKMSSYLSKSVNSNQRNFLLMSQKHALPFSPFSPLIVTKCLWSYDATKWRVTQCNGCHFQPFVGDGCFNIDNRLKPFDNLYLDEILSNGRKHIDASETLQIRSEMNRHHTLCSHRNYRSTWSAGFSVTKVVFCKNNLLSFTGNSSSLKLPRIVRKFVKIKQPWASKEWHPSIRFQKTDHTRFGTNCPDGSVYNVKCLQSVERILSIYCSPRERPRP